MVIVVAVSIQRLVLAADTEDVGRDLQRALLQSHRARHVDALRGSFCSCGRYRGRQTPRADFADANIDACSYCYSDRESASSC